MDVNPGIIIYLHLGSSGMTEGHYWVSWEYRRQQQRLFEYM